MTLYHYPRPIFFYLAAPFELENVVTVEPRSKGGSAVMNLESYAMLLRVMNNHWFALLQ
jgi:hypothetical protein